MPENQFICDCTAVHEDVVAQVSGQMLSDELYGYVASFFKLFGDKTRIKIVSVLEKHEMCVCDIANLLSMTKSAVSHQLALLRNARFVRCRREGKTVYYSLDDEHIRELLWAGITHIQEGR